jgi:hypothetical protein
MFDTVRPAQPLHCIGRPRIVVYMLYT